MKKIIIKFGAIGGLIVATAVIIMGIRMKDGDCGGGAGVLSMVFGYATMLLAFSTIFMAIRSYREKYQGGAITFGQGLKIGLAISFIASTIYVLVWVFIYKNYLPDFADKYFNTQLEHYRSKLSAADFAAKAKEMAEQIRIYKTWPGLIGFTYMEIFPVGILVSLIAAGIMRRKKVSVA